MEQEPRAVALITGVTGQTGSYLADLLLDRGYIVHGVTRGAPSDVPPRLKHIVNDPRIYEKSFFLHHCDILDVQAFAELLKFSKPKELYNLAAQSSVGLSFKQPLETVRIDGLGVFNILETVRLINPAIRVFLASSSEIFGQAICTPQNETTTPHPCSPYANAKLTAHALARVYREAYKMFVCSGILYNHESSRRGHGFVTQKIIRAAVRISLGLQDTLYLGNLDSGRDWGHARDFADCLWRMLQRDEPDDFIVATGISHTVRQFATIAFSEVNIDLVFEGEGLHEVGINKSSGAAIVRVDPQFFRPMEPNQIIGDASYAKDKLSWTASTTLHALVKEMIDAYQCELSTTRS